MNLTAEEIRVLGCLVEKQMTTPDYYPLTQNALKAACNQSTSRDPVMSLDDGEVIAAVNGLRDRRLVRAVHAPGQRAVKYRHVLDEAIGVEGPAGALLAVLLLRGDQTAGELRSRTGRYHEFGSLAEVTLALEDLARREPPLVEVLDRAPGEKESRWRHLLAADGRPEPAPAEPAAAGAAPSDPGDGLAGEVAALRVEVAELRARVEALAEALGEPR